MKKKVQERNCQTPKPTLIVVSNGITPYGMCFLQRVADELNEFNLRTIYTYEFSMGHWKISLPPTINAIILGKGEEATGRNSIDEIYNGWTRYRQLVKEIDDSSPVAVIILGYGNTPHFMLIEWCYKNGLPCLLLADSNILGDKNAGLKAWIKSLLVSRVVSRCKAILPCGTLGAQYFQKYGARKEQIFFVPVEPDYSLIDTISQDTVTSMMMEFKLEPARHRLIYSGRLVSIKRVDLLIDAFAELAEQRPGWDLLIAGGGPLQAELMFRVPEWLKKRVLWTGFINSQELMFALYRLSDVLVLPSDYEPWALVVNEAAYAGLVLVCSDVVGAAAELLCDRENGRSFKAGDIVSLVDALLDVTDEVNLSQYSIASQIILDRWREKADPIDGLRQALEFCFNTPTKKI
jgi:glycosyltransferase involved in cell wall biosynthesis